MGSGQSTPDDGGSFLDRIKTAWGCPNWFDLSNIPTCFSSLSIIEKVVLMYVLIQFSVAIIVIAVIAGEFLLGGEGAIEDLSSIAEDIETFVAFLSSFFESAFEWIAAAGAYIIALTIELVNMMAASTDTPPALWMFALGVLLFWAASKLISDVAKAAVAFDKTPAGAVFQWLNTPIRWVVDALADILGAWAGELAQIVALPINCVLLLVAEAIGWIWDVLSSFF